MPLERARSRARSHVRAALKGQSEAARDQHFPGPKLDNEVAVHGALNDVYHFLQEIRQRSSFNSLMMIEPELLEHVGAAGAEAKLLLQQTRKLDANLAESLGFLGLDSLSDDRKHPSPFISLVARFEVVDIISKHIQGLAKDALHYREPEVRDHFIAKYGLAHELCTSATPLQCAELFLAAEDLRKIMNDIADLKREGRAKSPSRPYSSHSAHQVKSLGRRSAESSNVFEVLSRGQRSQQRW